MFLLPLGPALARVDCEALVPAPVDMVPIRSPQSVHTRLANRFRNRTVVEIGTRNGDGMQCFAQVAKRAVAIEMDRQYCTMLSVRRKKLRQHGLGDYDILCDKYEDVPVATFSSADYIHWWLGGADINVRVLTFLYNIRAQLKRGVKAVVLHDPAVGVDNQSLSILGPAASIESVAVPASECAECYRAVKECRFAHDSGFQSCGRAAGTKLLAFFRLNNPLLPNVLREADGLKPWEGRVSWPATCNPGYSDKARDELVKTAHSSCPRECFEAPHPVHRHGCKTCMHHPRGGSCARCNSLGFDCHCTCSLEPLHPSRVPMHRHLPFAARSATRAGHRVSA